MVDTLILDRKHRWRRYYADLLDGAVQRANLRSALDEVLRDEALLWVPKTYATCRYS